VSVLELPAARAAWLIKVNPSYTPTLASVELLMRQERNTKRRITVLRALAEARGVFVKGEWGGQERSRADRDRRLLLGGE
jgi:hypothetical protein